ncbi:MAG: hypothetical protein JXQ67_09365 [Campylobacterales bacterium]|nr:hypothetical protein [Campylobacterales bacterium]
MKKILLTTALCATLVYAENILLPTEKRTFDQSKYIPDISLVLDTSYVTRNADPDEVGHFEVPGIAHGLLGSHGHDGATHATYNAKEGFNLNYAELILTSNVDPYFSMEGVFHMSENGFAIEEAYFTSTALEHGFRFKGGKFLSNFGYINVQHHHFWDFGDMPLVYESFLGMHGINEVGAQLQWTAPTPFYLMAGFELLQGTNEQMFGNETIGDPEDPVAKGATAPSLYVAYLKSSFDVGDTTFLGGLSYVYGESRIDHTEDEESPHAFSGVSQIYGADFLVKHYFDSYSYLKFQNEYLYRDMDGTQYSVDENVTVTGSTPLLKKQAGFYSQLIYAHDTNWRFGIRYDAFVKNEIVKNGPEAFAPDNMDKYSAMIEYHTSEFARFRFQYNRNNALYNEDGEQQHIDTFMLQANISIGAHGAHDF